jgi:hypothetical protein
MKIKLLSSPILEVTQVTTYIYAIAEYKVNKKIYFCSLWPLGVSDLNYCVPPMKIKSLSLPILKVTQVITCICAIAEYKVNKKDLLLLLVAPWCLRSKLLFSSYEN